MLEVEPTDQRDQWQIEVSKHVSKKYLLEVAKAFSRAKKCVVIISKTERDTACTVTTEREQDVTCCLLFLPWSSVLPNHRNGPISLSAGCLRLVAVQAIRLFIDARTQLCVKMRIEFNALCRAP